MDSLVEGLETFQTIRLIKHSFAGATGLSETSHVEFSTARVASMLLSTCEIDNQYIIHSVPGLSTDSVL